MNAGVPCRDEHHDPRLGVPASVEDPDFRASVDIHNSVESELLGHSLLADTYAESLSQWQANDYWRTTRVLAEVDGVAAGRGYLGMPLRDNLEKYWVGVHVLPLFRRRGIGTAILRHLSDIARAAGRHRAQAFATSPAITGEMLPSPTGFGGVAADAPSTAFLLNAGFRLEQAERISRLDLVADRGRFEETRARAARVSSPAYRVVTWRGRTPPERRDDVAWMHSRMSTDAPSAGLEIDEETWDADRLVRAEEDQESEDRFLLTAAAEDVASGRLVAFTVLGVPVSPDRASWQGDTLVTREHRGRRLGMLVKAANLVALADAAPWVPAVFTWNAEENRPMLDVNEALGFRPVGYEGAWDRKD